MQGPYAMRLSVKSVFQIGAATAIGIALCLGISAWIHWLRPVATYTARATPPRVLPTDIVAGATETVGFAQPRRIEPPPAMQNRLPFPLPVSYGVDAGSDSQLIELEPLPVEIPPSRSRDDVRRNHQTQPGGAAGTKSLRSWCSSRTSSNDVPAFGLGARGRLGFRAPSPSSTSRAKVTPLESSWRIRDKALRIKVSPIEAAARCRHPARSRSCPPDATRWR